MTYYSATRGLLDGHWGGHTVGERPDVEGAAPTSSPAAPRRRGWLETLARRGLYTGLALRLLGHMLLVVARRA